MKSSESKVIYEPKEGYRLGYVIGNPVSSTISYDKETLNSKEQQMRTAFPGVPLLVFDIEDSRQAGLYERSLLIGKEGYQCPWFKVQIPADIKKSSVKKFGSEPFECYQVDDAKKVEIQTLTYRAGDKAQEILYDVTKKPSSPTPSERKEGEPEEYETVYIIGERVSPKLDSGRTHKHLEEDVRNSFPTTTPITVLDESTIKTPAEYNCPIFVVTIPKGKKQPLIDKGRIQEGYYQISDTKDLRIQKIQFLAGIEYEGDNSPPRTKFRY